LGGVGRRWEELGGDVRSSEEFRGVGKVWVSLHSKYVYRLWILPSRIQIFIPSFFSENVL
jgi:hypothetical protein